MSISWWRLKSRVKTYGAALLLALLGALLAILVSVFLNSFSTLDTDHYEPKDVERGRMLQDDVGR